MELRLNQPRRSRGFTLIEAALAVVIVGVGVLAAAQLLAVGTKANADAHRLTTATHLAVNVRELVQQRTATQLLALNGQTYSPPRDARDQPIDGMGDWEQVISVTKVSTSLITVPVSASSSSRMLQLTVVVRHRGRALTTESWLLGDTSE